MKKYNKSELEEILTMANLSCYKLGRILDIPTYRVFKYLLNGEKIRPEEMIKLDAAIQLLRETKIRQPKWRVSDWWYGEEWEDTVGVWNDHLKELVRREVQHQDEMACDDILFVIGFGNINEYCTAYDPLKDCGLDKYSVDEFRNRIKQNIEAML